MIRLSSIRLNKFPVPMPRRSGECDAYEVFNSISDLDMKPEQQQEEPQKRPAHQAASFRKGLRQPSLTQNAMNHLTTWDLADEASNTNPMEQEDSSEETFRRCQEKAAHSRHHLQKSLYHTTSCQGEAESMGSKFDALQEAGACSLKKKKTKKNKKSSSTSTSTTTSTITTTSTSTTSSSSSGDDLQTNNNSNHQKHRHHSSSGSSRRGRLQRIESCSSMASSASSRGSCGRKRGGRRIVHSEHLALRGSHHSQTSRPARHSYHTPTLDSSSDDDDDIEEFH